MKGRPRAAALLLHPLDHGWPKPEQDTCLVLHLAGEVVGHDLSWMPFPST
jgi:hypothetical protein